MPHLSKLVLASLTFAVLCIGSATMAKADTLTFTGARLNVGQSISPVGRCAPALTLDINPSVGTSTGTSNFGAFTPTMSVCITPLPVGPLTDGFFTWEFAGGDTLSGTFTGGTAGVFDPTVTSVLDLTENYVIAGGTGLFAGATGNILGIGTLTIFTDRPASSTTNLTGTITTVPEPATMLLLSTGLAGVGAAIKKRRKKGAE
jgi:hypothetical protein